MITGYNDTFNRTVASGLGTATSGQAYTVSGTASQYNVVPSEARILPTATGDRFGYVDRQTSDIDITGQVSLTGIPATNLMTVGFVFKRSSNSDYYSGTMMVAAGGAVSLRFSKVVSGGLSTITTVATGITYVANTVYNLRVAAYWSSSLQANVLQAKLWAVGGTPPGGWQVSTTDVSHTQYTAGTTAGPFARDEASVPGAVTAKIQNVVATSYGLPVPASADTMCADPAVAFPKQTALESLADAVDAASLTLDPFADLAQFFPRIRVSLTNFTVNDSSLVQAVWTTTEFNIGTPTNLGYNPNVISLPQGLWLVAFDAQLDAAASSDWMGLYVSGGGSGSDTRFRTSTLVSNFDGLGGSGHVSMLAANADDSVPVSIFANFDPNVATAYTVRYASLSAVKISDYFA